MATCGRLAVCDPVNHPVGRYAKQSLQSLGFWPLNILSHQLAVKKIVGGMQRFRSGVEPRELPTVADMEQLVAPLPDDIPQARLGKRQLPIFS